MLRAWPSRGAEVDFGLATPDHYGALQHAVISDGVTIDQLDAALGSGERLQALVSKTNPYRFVCFRTDWDELTDLGEEPEEEIPAGD